MKHLIPILLLGSLLASFVPTAQAQTATRSTPCDPATPNNAVCVFWNPVTTASDGSTITGVTYRIEQRTGTTGAWATLTATIVNPQFLVRNLAPGAYQFRVFTSCAACTSESPNGSNIANGTATSVPKVPNEAVITIAVVISSDRAPVFRIVTGNKRGEIFGMVPLGRECTGPVLFRYRNQSYRRVAVNADEVWPKGTSTENLAAPCGDRA